jgi:hypothetical protein
MAYEVDKIQSIKEGLDARGYSSRMVFVNTSNVISEARNNTRTNTGGRRVSETLREEKWIKSQEARTVYKKVFGAGNFLEVTNNVDLSQATKLMEEQANIQFFNLFQNINEFIETPRYQMRRRGSSERKPNTLDEIRNKTTNWNDEFKKFVEENNPAAREWGKPSLTAIYQAETPGEEGYPDQTKKKDPMNKTKPRVKVHKNIGKLGDGNKGISQTYGVMQPNVGGMAGQASVPLNEDFLPEDEQIRKWAMKPETQAKFIEKYGAEASTKLIETAFKFESVDKNKARKPKKS